MISNNRLRVLARENEVTTGLMEKDYVNSWILHGIYTSKLKDKLFFKGGTALSKIYFPKTWRFSEDLDLTATKEITEKEFKEALKSSLSETSRVSGITFEIKNLYMNPGYLQALIQYDALLGQKNTTKLDITLDELVYFELEQKVHSFEDVPEFDINVYSLEEILVEKIRSLFERDRARDYFDLHKIMKTRDFEMERIAEALKEKMKSKNMELNLDIPEERVEDVESYWDKGLERYISTTEKPKFKEVMKTIQELLNKLREIDDEFND